MRCTHFIGFRDGDQFWRACQIFGKPDFIHIKWDERARFGGEIHPDDTLVFAGNESPDVVHSFSVDDSSEDIPSDEELTRRGL